MTRPTGVPCWIDLLSSDTARTTPFYTELFGWTAGEESPEFGGYFMFFAEGAPVAGCMPNQPGTGFPDGWCVHFSAADAKAAADRALARGGTVDLGPTDIGDLGTQVVLTDAVGARVGVWEPKAFPGFGEYSGQPGTPAYFELLTRDHDGAVRFYRDVFCWGPEVIRDTPQFRLTGLTDGSVTLAGIMDASGFLPADEGDHWGVYLKVADADAALATATRLGGSVTQEPEDTPYGRLAGVADPLGARFRIAG